MDGIDVDFQAVEDFAGVAVHARAVDEQAEAQRPAAEKDVLADVEVSAQREVLIDHLDAAFAAFVRGAEMDGLAVDENFAGIALIGAGQDLHQRRFACGIVADEAEHLAGRRASG